MFEWPRKSRSTSGTGGTRKYVWLCLKDFWNFFIIYVFVVKESIADIPIELFCSGNLENPRSISGTWGALRYWKLCLIDFRNFFTIQVLWSRNPFPTIQLSYHVWVTSKIHINVRYRKYSKVLMIVSHRYLTFLHYLCFCGPGIHCRHSTELPCLGDLVNPGQLPVQEVLEGTDDCVS